MDENRVEGAARNVTGKAQETLGSAVGNMESEAKGRAKQAIGQAQNLYGNAVDTARSYTDEQPLTALLVAGGIGLAIGILLGRR